MPCLRIALIAMLNMRKLQSKSTPVKGLSACRMQMMPPNGARPKKQTPSVQLTKNVAHVLFAPQQDVEIARKTDEIEKLS